VINPPRHVPQDTFNILVFQHPEHSVGVRVKTHISEILFQDGGRMGVMGDI
jgi:hypothetical protein